VLLADRLHTVEERICAACRRAGRPRSDVTLVAVTKSVAPAVAAQIAALGVHDLGENRPQQLWRKAVALPGVRWHLIGHLQRNKIDRTLPLVQRIHAVDSVRLLEALEQAAGRRGQSLEVLLECNASGEATKQGFAMAQVPALVPRLATCRHVHVTGLMTMAALQPDPERCRPAFAALRQLRDHLRLQFPPPHRLEHLSMGMSNDFEVAIDEGATLIRLGTVLFQGLEEKPS
jgi:pyridoxal phosphate enzyme (YggS family)